MNLQITSMVDIFTIILVFLLKSLASNTLPITPTAELPIVAKPEQKELNDAFVVEVLRTGLVFDQKLVVPLKEFMPGRSLRQENASDITSHLTDVLKKKIMNRPAIASAQKKESKLLNTSLTVMADKQTPYLVLEEIMAVASQCGFHRVQLVMVKDEG